MKTRNVTFLGVDVPYKCLWMGLGALVDADVVDLVEEGVVGGVGAAAVVAADG